MAGVFWSVRLHDLMDRVVNEQEAAAITQNRRGDAGRQQRARHPHPQDGRRVMQRHRVLNLMTHVDPWKRPDLDHLAVLQDKRSPTG